MQKVRAKVYCQTKKLSPHTKSDGSIVEAAHVSFVAVGKDYPDTGLKQPEENKMFGEFTPSFSLQQYIVNPAAHAMFEPGKCYYVDFTPAE